MGLFSGSRRAAPVAPAEVERSFTLPAAFRTSGNFAQATVAGTGALASVAVRSSVDLICSLISELPLDVYRGEGSDRRQLRLPDYLQDPGDTGNGLEDWVYTLVQSWLTRGNAYGDPVRDRLNRLQKLELRNPDEVGAILNERGLPEWTVNGKPAPGLYHSRVNPMAGILLGFSPVEAHATTILSSIVAGRFGLQWFTDGTHPQSMLVNTEAAIDQKQAEEILRRWRVMKSGTREPAVMGKGWELRGLDITPEQAQLLQIIGMSEAQACRIFGPAIAETLGYESGGSMTYTNVADRRSDLMSLSLNKWARRVERLLSSMLPAPQYARFDRDALLESTTLARYEAYASALQNGWRTVNEVRDDEDLAPLPGGDLPKSSQAAGVGGTNGNAAG